MSYVEESTVIDETIYDLINEAFENEGKYKDAKFRNSIFSEHNDYFVKTDDGSYSIKSKEINNKVETLHTSTGAISESFEKFIKPLKLDYDEDIAILDICAGLGYNSSAAIDDFIKNSDGSTNLHIDMLEISKPTLAAGLMVPSPIKAHDITKKAIEQALIDCEYASLELESTEIPSNTDLKIHIDDARQVIRKLSDNSYDAIFLDPFSQNMSPELVSVDFFKEFRRVIKENGIVCTYTSSSPVRMTFIEADFYVSLGPIFGRFQGGTLASPNPKNLTKSLPKNDEIKMALSDVGIPFRDPNLNLSSQEILDNRTEERHYARHNTKISSAVKTPIFLGQEMDDEPLKRRVERNLAKMNIPGVLSEEALYIVEPENDYKEEYFEDNNTRTRVLEMMERLDEIKNKSKISLKENEDE
ncbi:MAG: SAM-dependent methyltransferase [Methanobrevibacter sp.]|uniref:MnmC family methyltransferase n=1 Tax=Methanobrevibacter sp. TaxID=66852 RepID=UPI0026013D93|nr:MnmC family methyltransferase [Methanobrevibacter sp.]MBQ6138739.1 SAM-dependent methyltransferase [Methanobrevibacter sp.]